MQKKKKEVPKTEYNGCKLNVQHHVPVIYKYLLKQNFIDYYA